MRRRRFLQAAGAFSLALFAPDGKAGQAQTAMWDESPEGKKHRAEALAAFPFKRVEVPGRHALQAWERLEREGQGAAVVVGDDEALTRIIAPFHSDWWHREGEPGLAEILARADRLAHPQSLFDLQEAERASFKQWCDDNPAACDEPMPVMVLDAQTGKMVELTEPSPRQLLEEGNWNAGPPVGEWPSTQPGPVGLTVAEDLLTGRPLERVHIILVPTDDWTSIPAHLRWGGWNANPTPEYHVAALRSWRDRYGARLVGLGPDSMNVRVQRRPQTREEALALAREFHAYCNDTIDQGLGTLSNLAAALMSGDWWFFWWD